MICAEMEEEMEAMIRQRARLVRKIDILEEELTMANRNTCDIQRQLRSPEQDASNFIIFSKEQEAKERGPCPHTTSSNPPQTCSDVEIR